ncbi:hypothetical protein V2J09_010974 [Rumex salicifolius]
MAGREVKEYTNLSDPKDKKWGKGKDKIDDEDITFQRMVAKFLLYSFSGSQTGMLLPVNKRIKAHQAAKTPGA